MGVNDSHKPTLLPELIQLAPDPFFLSDSSGRYIEVNDAGCQLLRASRAEILGKSAADFMWPQDAPTLHGFAEQLKTSGDERFEWTLRRADGTSVPIEVHSRLLPDGKRQSIIRDISERKQREHEQQREHEALEWLQKLGALYLSGQGDEAILEATLDAAIALSQADCGHIQVLDEAAAAMRIVVARGFSPDWLTFRHRTPVARQTVEAAFAQRRRTILEDVQSSPLLTDSEEIAEYGREGVRALVATPIFSRAGQLLGVISTHYKTARLPPESELRRLDVLASQAADIFAHRRAERMLRHAEAVSSGILAASADAVICIDAQRRIVKWNASAEQMFGYAEQEALGLSIEQLLPEDRRAAHVEHVARFATESTVGRRMAHSSTSGRRKSGETFPIDATISHLEVDGQLILTATVRDVTERKRRENEQRLFAELGGALASLDYDDTMRQIVQLAATWIADFAGIFVIDGPGGELRRTAVATQDPALVWVAQSVMELPKRPPLEHPVWQVLEEQRPVQFALQPQQGQEVKQSSELPEVFQAAALRVALLVPLVADGKSLGVLKLSRRTGEFDEQSVRLAVAMASRCALYLENARLHRAERTATRARDEVLQVVAHDLRNPLNAIHLQLQILLRRRLDPDGRWQEPADKIRGSCQQMNSLIEDLLDVTRLEASALSMTMSPLSTEQVIAEALERQQPLAAAASIELRCELATDLPRIQADPRRLLQVFQNLIGNALKFTPAGGCVTIGAALQANAVEFSVRDTGPGIPAEHLAHLFDRFWQADRTDRRGIGLGLAIVRGIVAAHGGQVRVESELGRGSTFFFSIPLAAAQP